jgi:hypothetical protein
VSRAWLIAALALGACAKDKPAPKADGPCTDPFAAPVDDAAELAGSPAQIELPPVPDFVVPAPNSDGSHTVKELRVAGDRLKDHELQIRGVVVSLDADRFWIADAATDHVARWIPVAYDALSPPKVAVGDAVVVTGTGTDSGGVVYTAVAATP